MSTPYAGFGAKSKSPPRPINEFFKSRSEVTIPKKGLRLGVWGGPEVGKTHVICTCPPPVYVIDTEYGIHPVMDNFPDKDIRPYSAVLIDDQTGKPDPLFGLNEIEASLDALKDIEQGTIAIDSGSDVWSWINEWLETVATKRNESGQPYRFEWGKANARYRSIMMRLIPLCRRGVNFVITAQEKNKYTKKGEQTSDVEASWQDKTDHWVDVVLHMQKRFVAGQWKYISTINKCRYRRAANLEIEDATYDKIIDALRNKLKVNI